MSVFACGTPPQEPEFPSNRGNRSSDPTPDDTVSVDDPPSNRLPTTERSGDSNAARDHSGSRKDSAASEPVTANPNRPSADAPDTNGAADDPDSSRDPISGEFADVNGSLKRYLQPKADDRTPDTELPGSEVAAPQPPNNPKPQDPTPPEQGQDPTPPEPTPPDQDPDPTPPDQSQDPGNNIPLPQPPTADTTTPEYPAAFLRPECSRRPSGTCYTLDARLDEASGIAPSLLQEGVFYSHNDGGKAVVYAINQRGEILARITIKGATNHDFEDIATYKSSSGSFIVQGDIGDKDQIKGQVTIYKFPEPAIDPSQRDTSVTVTTAEKITLQYPTSFGLLDFEAMMIDPLTGDLFLFEKGHRRVFAADHQALASGRKTVALTLLVSDGAWDKNPSGADFSPRGTEFIIRNETRAWLYRRDPGESLAQALQSDPVVIDMPDEYNGEAICFDRQGLNLYTVSENKKKGEDPVAPQPVSILRRDLE